MKARIKATGEIVEVKSKVITSFTGEHRLKYIDQDTGVSYFEEDLFFPMDLVNDPDYWTRLEHQYAGMAMQGLMTILPNIGGLEGRTPKDEIVDIAIETAHALVEKMKEKEAK